MSSIKLKKRQLILGILFIIILLGLVFRVAWLQFVDGEELTEKAYYQQTKDILVTANRGKIYDVTGKVLAESATTDCISLDIAQLKEPEKVSKKLSEILQLDYDTVLKKATNKKVSTQIIKRRVESKETKEIREWISQEKISGVSITSDSKRYYPYNNVASHVIGFTGSDNQGLLGIESIYDKTLRGTPGRVFANVDAGQKEMKFSDEKYYNPEDGYDIVLTIDYNIQKILETHLETAIIDNKCTNGGAAVAINPKTGEVLGLTVKPDFNLNTPFEPNTNELKAIWSGLESKQKSKELDKVWRNKVLVDAYEPGSTFKTITAAIGIEEGIVKKEDIYTCAPISVGGHTINCWTSPHGSETFEKAMMNSCNPVMVQVAQKVGKETYYKYMEAFGLKNTTGIELPEVTGQIHNYNSFGSVELATVSFGMRFTVTPIQMITALSAAINGGTLLKPSLIKEVKDSNGNIISQFERKAVKTLISEETSQNVREILENVVSTGTGKNARVEGYRIGGKTGTADLLDGTYVISFFGFATVNDPELAILLLLYNPTGELRTGGAVAAPIVGKMFKDILSYQNQDIITVPSNVNEEIEVPNVIGLTVKEAYSKMKEVGLQYRLSGQSNNETSIVKQQTPKEGAKVNVSTQVILFTEDEGVSTRVTVPLLQGLTIDEAKKKLMDLGLNLNAIGSGVASTQVPSAGSEVLLGTIVEANFYEKTGD